MGLLSNDSNPGNLIVGETLDLTRIWTWFAAGLGIVGPAAYALFKDESNEFQQEATFAVAAIMVAAIIGIAIAVAADLRARASVTAAQKAKEAALTEKWTSNLIVALDKLVSASAEVYSRAEGGQQPSGTVGAIAAGRSLVAPVGAFVSAKIKDQGEETFLLLAILRDQAAKRTEYLVVRPGGTLEWKTDAEIESISYPYEEEISATTPAANQT